MEIEGFVYETLGTLSVSTTTTASIDQSDSDQLEPYSVFRNQISLSSLNSPSQETAAPEYFSLDAADDEEGWRPHSSIPPSPAAASAPSRGVDRTLELGWFRANSRFKSPMLQLHKEILDFCDFLSPTPEEQASRTTAVECVFDTIKYVWPNCKVEVFGSFKTGLYLPTSDIDVVILDSNVKTPQIGLKALSRALSQRGIAKKIQVIAKARVPIIKFVEKRSGIAFDISFDVQNGPKAADFIKDAVAKMPPLRPLCLILKVFLQQRELNEVYSGGIGSYALLTMLIAHLQMYWKGQGFQGRQTSLEHNLGVLLVNFFDLFGNKLNTWDVGISCKGAGTFFLKNKKGFLNTGRPFLLSIEDPQTADNDIGKNSFNYSQIRCAFALAYSRLTNAKIIMNLGKDRSILGTIIRPDPVLLERKGGVNGDITFDSLLPGASEPLELQFGNEQEMLCNWQLDDDDEEPLPRGKEIAVEDGVGEPSSSRKRKIKTGVKENGEMVKVRQENGFKKEKREKPRWRKYQSGGGSTPNVGGSSWIRRR